MTRAALLASATVTIRVGRRANSCFAHYLGLPGEAYRGDPPSSRWFISTDSAMIAC
jgi:hypothetical protein